MTQKGGEQPKNRPNPQEAITRARDAAAPKVAKAMEAAAPKVEKAAASAGKLLGTLRERARETVKTFADAYGSDEHDESPPGANPNAADRSKGSPTEPSRPAQGAGQAPGEPPRRRPRPGPGPG